MNEFRLPIIKSDEMVYAYSKKLEIIRCHWFIHEKGKKWKFYCIHYFCIQ